ncbi:MAG: AAA family ATPase, partial [Rickettsiales bacterium]|nr:AAA family ATPase [Rickettsiales bacterium]
MANNSGEFLRQLPQNIDAEQALLSSVFLNNRAIEKVSDFLFPEHFASSVHAEIYSACQRLTAQGHLADAITLKDYFLSNGKLDEIGGVDYLFKLANAPISGASIYEYGKLIYDKALRRSLIGFGEEVISEAFAIDIEKDAERQIEIAEQKLFSLSTTGLDNSDAKAISFGLAETLQQTEYARGQDGNLSGVSTGFTDLNKILGGLTPSDLLIVAGRPGMGKSTFALSMLFNVANEVANGRVMKKLNGPALFFSLEMSADQLAAKILSSVSDVSSYDMRIGKVSNDDVVKLKSCSQQIEKLPIYIDDTPSLSVNAIRTRARRMKMKHGGLSCIVIDYIQLLSPPGGSRADNRVVELSEMTRGLKMLAKELEVPVVALSQLSRAVETRGTKP